MESLQDTREIEAIERVEWLAALWDLTERGDSRCANPHLLTLLQFSPEVTSHPGLEWMLRARREHSRDRLIKAVVRATYGGSAQAGEEHAALCSFVADLPRLLGRGPYDLIQQARNDALRHVQELAGKLDAAGDLAAVTGERLPLRVVLAPSVFLPPPQGGRHGALVRQPDGWVAHLHFGFPLKQPPQQYNISQPWLLGGAWHYAIHIYLERYWPAVAQRLRERSDLAEAMTEALGPSASDGAWTDALQAHLNVALKCFLARRRGLPDAVHRAFARARGLVLFPWFEEWLPPTDTGGAALATHIATLPDALVATRARWEALARASSSAPPTVNLALIAPNMSRACLVVPDDWSDATVASAVSGWRLLSLPHVRYSEWVSMHPSNADPVIAFGEPDRNPLVRRVLEQRSLSLTALTSEDPAIVALSQSGFEGAAWCIAVAVRRPESATKLRVELALRQTSSYVIFDNGAVVDSGRVSIEQLLPAEPSDPGLAAAPNPKTRDSGGFHS